MIIYNIKSYMNFCVCVCVGQGSAQRLTCRMFYFVTCTILFWFGQAAQAFFFHEKRIDENSTQEIMWCKLLVGGWNTHVICFFFIDKLQCVVKIVRKVWDVWWNPSLRLQFILSIYVDDYVDDITYLFNKLSSIIKICKLNI